MALMVTTTFVASESLYELNPVNSEYDLNVKHCNIHKQCSIFEVGVLSKTTVL